MTEAGVKGEVKHVMAGVKLSFWLLSGDGRHKWRNTNLCVAPSWKALNIHSFSWQMAALKGWALEKSSWWSFGLTFMCCCEWRGTPQRQVCNSSDGRRARTHTRRCETFLDFFNDTVTYWIPYFSTYFCTSAKCLLQAQVCWTPTQLRTFTHGSFPAHYMTFTWQTCLYKATFSHVDTLFVSSLGFAVLLLQTDLSRSARAQDLAQCDNEEGASTRLLPQPRFIRGSNQQPSGSLF